jgi:cytochrome P450
VCPGQNLVLLTASTFLATLLRGRDLQLQQDRLNPDRPLPLTFSPYRLSFRLTRR